MAWATLLSRPFIAAYTFSASVLQQFSMIFFTVSEMSLRICASFSCSPAINFCLFSVASFSFSLSTSISRSSTFSLFLARSAAWASSFGSSASWFLLFSIWMASLRTSAYFSRRCSWTIRPSSAVFLISAFLAWMLAIRSLSIFFCRSQQLATFAADSSTCVFSSSCAFCSCSSRASDLARSWRASSERMAWLWACSLAVSSSLQLQSLESSSMWWLNSFSWALHCPSSVTTCTRSSPTSPSSRRTSSARSCRANSRETTSSSAAIFSSFTLASSMVRSSTRSRSAQSCLVRCSNSSWRERASSQRFLLSVSTLMILSLRSLLALMAMRLLSSSSLLSSRISLQFFSRSSRYFSSRSLMYSFLISRSPSRSFTFSPSRATFARSSATCFSNAFTLFTNALHSSLLSSSLRLAVCPSSCSRSRWWVSSKIWFSSWLFSSDFSSSLLMAVSFYEIRPLTKSLSFWHFFSSSSSIATAFSRPSRSLLHSISNSTQRSCSPFSSRRSASTLTVSFPSLSLRSSRARSFLMSISLLAMISASCSMVFSSSSWFLSSRQATLRFRYSMRSCSSEEACLSEPTFLSLRSLLASKSVLSPFTMASYSAISDLRSSFSVSFSLRRKLRSSSSWSQFWHSVSLSLIRLFISSSSSWMSLCSSSWANSYLFDSFSLCASNRPFSSFRKRFSYTIFHRLLFVSCSFCSRFEERLPASRAARDRWDRSDLLEIWLYRRRSVLRWVVEGVLRMRVNSIRMISLMLSLNFSKSFSTLVVFMRSFTTSSFSAFSYTRSRSSPSSFAFTADPNSSLCFCSLLTSLLRISTIWSCLAALLTSSICFSLNLAISPYASASAFSNIAIYSLCYFSSSSFCLLCTSRADILSSDSFTLCFSFSLTSRSLMAANSSQLVRFLRVRCSALRESQLPTLSLMVCFWSSMMASYFAVDYLYLATSFSIRSSKCRCLIFHCPSFSPYSFTASASESQRSCRPSICFSAAVFSSFSFSSVPLRELLSRSLRCVKAECSFSRAMYLLSMFLQSSRICLFCSLRLRFSLLRLSFTRFAFSAALVRAVTVASASKCFPDISLSFSSWSALVFSLRSLPSSYCLSRSVRLISLFCRADSRLFRTVVNCSSKKRCYLISSLCFSRPVLRSATSTATSEASSVSTFLPNSRELMVELSFYISCSSRAFFCSTPALSVSAAATLTLSSSSLSWKAVRSALRLRSQSNILASAWSSSSLTSRFWRSMVSLRRRTSLFLVRMMLSLAFSCSSNSQLSSSDLFFASYSSCRSPPIVFSSKALLSAISFFRVLLSATREAIVSSWILFLRSRLLHSSRTQARSRSFFCSSVSCAARDLTFSFLSASCFSSYSAFTRVFIISRRSAFSLASSAARCRVSSLSCSLSRLNFSLSFRQPSRQTSLSSKEVRCEAYSIGNYDRRLLAALLPLQVAYFMVENLLLGDFVKVLNT